VTVLTILEEGDRDAIVLDTRDVGAITQALQAVGVTLERSDARGAASADADNDVLLLPMTPTSKRLAEIGGYKSFDVIRMPPYKPEARGDAREISRRAHP